MLCLDSKHSAAAFTLRHAAGEGWWVGRDSNPGPTP